MPDLSVIIPVYNTEKYLEQCIRSIQKQTYSNIEIILVDDGSPDNSGRICDKYAQMDKRIEVIHKENGGLSDARNKGIDISKGKYITFVDSDDYIEEMYIESLYKAIKNDDTLISQCSISKVNNDKVILEKIGYNEKSVKKGKDLLEDACKTRHVIENIVVWNKMYDISLFENLRFPVGKIHEDEFITYKILYDVDKISIINKYLYNYRQTNESIMGKRFNTRRLDLLEALEEKMGFFKRKKEIELYSNTLKYYLCRIREYYIMLKLYVKDSKIEQKKLLKKYRIGYNQYIKQKNISIVKKVKALVFYFFPNVFYYLKKHNY